MASAAQATHLQVAAHVPSALVAHTSTAQSILVATVEHVVGVATSSLAHLQGIVEQALVATVSHIAAAGAAYLWDAVAANKLAPCEVANPRLPLAPDAALPPGLPMEELSPLQEASNSAPPPPLPPPAGTPQASPCPVAPSFAAQQAAGTWPPERHTMLPSRPSQARRPPPPGGPLLWAE